MNITRQPVTSRSLKSIGYAPAKRMLEVEFHDGSVYRYLNVPAIVHRDLLAAPSIGAYFAHFIKTQFKAEHVRRAG